MSDSVSAAVQQLQPAPIQHFRPYKIDLLTGATNWYQWRNLQVQVLRTMGLYEHISSDTSAKEVISLSFIDCMSASKRASDARNCSANWRSAVPSARSASLPLGPCGTPRKACHP